MLLLPLACLSVLAAAAPPARNGLFSREAVSIGDSMRWSTPPEELARGSLRVRSPDGASVLRVSFREFGSETDGSFDVVGRFRLSGRAGAATLLVPAHLGDILWSPDSRHVALSLSTGGLGGVYDLFILGRGTGTRPLSEPFRRRLAPPARCDLRDISNVAAIKWLSNRELLVMARQLWEDDCPERYRAVFYAYDIEKRTIRRAYSHAEAKRRFGSSFGKMM